MKIPRAKTLLSQINTHIASKGNGLVSNWVRCLVRSTAEDADTKFEIATTPTATPPHPIHGGYLQSSSCSFHDEIFCREELHDGVGGLLGSHNFRKLGSSHARKNGCHQEEKDLRGRWKRPKHVSDVYDDVELPFPDAKVAGRGTVCWWTLQVCGEGGHWRH